MTKNFDMEKNQKKTRILAVGDIHGDSRLVKKLAEKAERENIDLVILAGDITFLDNEVKNIISPFMKINKKVLLLHGNHEGVATIDSFTEIYPNTKNIHGYSVRHNNIGIFGVGGADGPGPGGTVIESELFSALKQSHEYIKDASKKIMVTHMHPAGTKSEFSGIEGSKSIRKAIEKFQPNIAIFGHIHEAGGIEEKIGNTTIINVSRKETIFEL